MVDHVYDYQRPMSAGSGPVVLVVEDNAQMRSLIRSLLQEIASEVHECESGESAIAAYSRLHPDWVLMDIAMEDIDGIQATQTIRRMDPGARVGNLSVGARQRVDRLHRAEATAAGACAYVLKENLLELPSLLVAGSKS